jgi:glycosyltransferase involved in cell wall biosynthesis
VSDIVYAVWGEDVVSSPLFDNQVAELLLELRRRGHRITLLIGLPIPTLLRRDGLRPAALKSALSRLRHKLARIEQAGIPVHVRRLHGAFGFYSPFWALPFYHAGHLRFLLRLVANERAQIVHCRSYHAALLACLARRLGANFKIVFDARSLFPEEGVVSARYRERGLSFALWKRIEHMLLSQSDVTVCVSERNGRFLRASAPDAKIVTIRPCVNTRSFHPTAVPSDPPVWVYSGNLARNNPWYSPDALARTYRLGRQVFSDLRLLILTTRDHDWIRGQLLAQGLEADRFAIRAAHDIDAVARELSAAHCGLMPLRAPDGGPLRKIFEGGLSVKTGEYLAAGLPVVCDGELGEVADLIAAHGIGVTLNSDPASALAQLQRLREEYPDMRRRCIEVSKTFSLEHVATRYEQIYASL